MPSAPTFLCCFIMEILCFIKNKNAQHHLNETIMMLNQADTAIRKNISLFHESKLLSSSSESHYKKGQICLNTIIDLLHILYAEVKMLESIQLPDYTEMLYDPLEELSDCIYFQNSELFSSDHLKALYNIFLFFQSQYLLRFYLTIRSNRKEGLKYLNSDNVRLRNCVKMYIEKLSSMFNASFQQIFQQKNLRGMKPKSSMRNSDLSKIKRSSMDILCRLINITNEFHTIDNWVQFELEDDSGIEVNREWINISKRMEQSKASLDICKSDFETFILINSKFFRQNVQSPIEDDDQSRSEHFTNTSMEIEDNENLVIEERNDEYFGIYDTISCKDNDGLNEIIRRKNIPPSEQDECSCIDMEITRSSFAPVLKQLKMKILPIQTKMKERELKFLLSKGMDREKILNFDKKEDILLCETSTTSTDNFKSKLKPSHDRFEEMRSFLQQKPSVISIPPNNLPLNNYEDIIE
ncbi:uncharacterized protein LOC116351090 isoform X2 [Contarinia nasturtii]|uniref:uncharacterized protein LOC116351090 isoform X2 n=1 Tax=Contarinia nasturtii TaxID=265458 RepID=UPI0012D4779A|nr:uncharacterized protein LOC116351090 isoform X2 [Contarinia nasturtii]